MIIISVNYSYIYIYIYVCVCVCDVCDKYDDTNNAMQYSTVQYNVYIPGIKLCYDVVIPYLATGLHIQVPAKIV